MKRIVIFIGLKLAELSVLGSVIVGLSLLGQWIKCNYYNYYEARQSFESWAAFGENFIEGIVSIFLIVLVLVLFGAIIYGTIYLVKKNWKWSKKLARKE